MNNIEPLTLQIPAQGWKQFLTSRKDMLDKIWDAVEEYKQEFDLTKEEAWGSVY